MGVYALDWHVVLSVAQSKGIEIDDVFYAALIRYEQILINAMNKGK